MYNSFCSPSKIHLHAYVQYLFLFIGVIHSLTDNFRALRDARVDKYVVETNKLLIRLDKLISPEAPAEGSKRKGNKREFIYIW